MVDATYEVVTVHEAEPAQGKKKGKMKPVRRKARVIDEIRSLESILFKVPPPKDEAKRAAWAEAVQFRCDKKGLPEAVVLRINEEQVGQGVVLSRDEILAVNRQIRREKDLSDKAAKNPLLAVYIDEKLNTQVNDNCTGTLVRGTTGCGKCWAPETPLILADGSTCQVGQLIAGDRLMGPDGTERHVMSVTRGRGPMFRIKGSDGTSFICNDAHILVLRDKGGQPPPSGAFNAAGDMEIEVAEFIEEIGLTSGRWRMFRAAVAVPEGERADLPDEYEFEIEPLGEGDYAGFTVTGDGQCLLADRTVTHNTACIGNMLLHQAYRHQCGIIKDSWWGSSSFLGTYYFELRMEREAAAICRDLTKIEDERSGLEMGTEEMRDDYLSAERFFKYYELEREETEIQIRARIRQLHALRAAGTAGLFKLTERGDHRPEEFKVPSPLVGGKIGVPSVFTGGVDNVLNPKSTYDDFRASRPFLRNIHKLANTRSAVKDCGLSIGAEPWLDEDEHLRELRDTLEATLRRSGSAKALMARLQPAYDAYIQKRGELTERANEAGYKLSKLTSKTRHANYGREMLNLKYRRMPWGGLLIDQKGSYHAVVSSISKAYGKLALLTLIQVRPSWAQAEKDRHKWSPLVKWNLLSMPKNLINSRSYAEIFCSTGASFDGGGKSGGAKNDYFVKGSQNFITVGIELAREICTYIAKLETAKHPEKRQVKERLPSLLDIYRLLTDKDRFSYLAYLDRYGLKEIVEKPGKETLARLAGLKQNVLQLEALRRDGNYTDAKAEELLGPVSLDAKYRPEFMSSSLLACMEELETYFSYDKGQLSGLTGTIQNVLNPYVSEDMAEIFCAPENTVDITDIDYGTVFCLAMSQKYAEERKYICVLLKKLIYFHNRLRNDKQGPDWDLEAYTYIPGGNSHYVFQDECQDTATNDDQEIDKFRSQGMCAVFLTQSIVALYDRLGGKDRAQAFFNNINNLYVGTSGDKDDAQISAEALGQYMTAEYNRSKQAGLSLDPGSYSYSIKERFIIRPHEIRALPKFTFYVAFKSQSSEKGAAVRRFLVGPREADGVTPRHWWPAKLKERDKWEYFCQWLNDDYKEFTKVPLTFNIQPTMN